MNKFKKIGIVGIVFGIAVSFGIGYNYLKKETVKFHKNQTDHNVFIDLAVNPEDMEAYVGLVDYVFVGRVDEYLGNINENSDFIPDSQYQITVLQNLKGNLQMDNPIKVKKHGGYNANGELILLSGENIVDFLPEEGKQYIFMAYGQPNGELLIAELNGNVELPETMTYSDGETSSLIQQYQDYIKEEKTYERTRFNSIYEK